MRKVSPRYGPGQRWRSGTVESDAGPVDGPDAWDGYRAAVVRIQGDMTKLDRPAPEFQMETHSTARASFSLRKVEPTK